MISYHPESSWLRAFAAGELPPSLALAVSVHVELCPVCQRHLAALEAELASLALTEPALEPELEAPGGPDWDAMLAAIMATPQSVGKPSAQACPPLQVDWQASAIALPRAMRHLVVPEWQQVGKVARARLDIAASQHERTSLLSIAPGAVIPEHTHKGYELTLLLAGDMTDAEGTYRAGDFLLLDRRHEHSPSTHAGCLCLTVLDAPVHFTRGLPRLLNGFSGLLY